MTPREGALLFLALASYATAIVALVLSSVAAIALVAARFTTRSGPLPRVILLRPRERSDERWLRAISNDFRAYGGPFERWLVVASGPADENTLVAPEDRSPMNPKMSKLVFAVSELEKKGVSEDDVIVHADADVRLPEGSLDELVARLPKNGVAAAFAVACPEGGTVAARFLARSVLLTSTQSFAAVWALERMLGRPPNLSGKIVAMSAATLRTIGGYEVARESIGDDLAISEALVAHRGKVLLGPAVASFDEDRTLQSQLAQFVRWLRVLRAHRPALAIFYPLVTAPLALGLPLFLLSEHFSPRDSLRVLAGLALLARVGLGMVLAWRVYRKVPAPELALRLLLAPLVDFVLLGIWARAISSREILWNGRSYEIGPRGKILGVRARMVRSHS